MDNELMRMGHTIVLAALCACSFEHGVSQRADAAVDASALVLTLEILELR